MEKKELQAGLNCRLVQVNAVGGKTGRNFRSAKVRVRDIHQPPWVDREIVHLLRKKNNLRRKANVVSHHEISASEPRFKANLFNNYSQSVFNAPVAGESVRDFVSKALRYLDVNKASFGIPSRLLKECSEEITVPVTTLFIKTLGTGVFTNQWKDANLVPIHKAERKSIVSNYKGISLLDQLSKILEKGVFGRLFDFVSPKLTTWQHGFFPGRSTVTQLLQVVHLLSSALDKKQQVDLVYLDFSKGFDRVPHDKFLPKLGTI
ncbi:Hypothetical predicted protein [Paramuricea clavata]|uniref:Uncharacterized protein n=2 Tax=Paramuricea clavata TaxID=317549 RepID=A0A7D9HGU6_PARCT|nr:Hypothetical predicted protein [Paramuricea clavata]